MEKKGHSVGLFGGGGSFLIKKHVEDPYRNGWCRKEIQGGSRGGLEVIRSKVFLDRENSNWVEGAFLGFFTEWGRKYHAN